MIKKMKSKTTFIKLIWTLLAGFFLSSCGTITPDLVTDKSASFDGSTPHQYDSFNSGILFFISNESNLPGAVITANARDRYNALIASYQAQFLEVNKTRLSKDDGLTSFLDQWGNPLFFIDSQHLSYFMDLNQWKKNGRDSDSVWQKLKGAL